MVEENINQCNRRKTAKKVTKIYRILTDYRLVVRHICGHEPLYGVPADVVFLACFLPNRRLLNEIVAYFLREVL